MSYLDLGVLYLLGGLVSAGVVWRSSRQWSSALLCVFLWPLWLPVAFGERSTRWRPPDTARPQTSGTPGAAAPKPADGGVAERVRRLLAEARVAATGSSFEQMLSEDAAARIAAEVERAALRLDSLDELLAEPRFRRDQAAAKLAALAGEGATEATLRTARLHLESVERLAAMRAEQSQALVELEQVVTALRSQLEVARYAGSMSEGFDAIVADLWSRVEGLGETFDAPGPENGPEHAPDEPDEPDVSPASMAEETS